MLKKISLLIMLVFSIITITAHADSRDDALKQAKADVAKQEQIVTTAHDNMIRKASSTNRAYDIFQSLAQLNQSLQNLPKTDNSTLEAGLSQEAQDTHQLAETAFKDFHVKDRDYASSRRDYQKEYKTLEKLKKHLYNIIHNRY